MDEDSDKIKLLLQIIKELRAKNEELQQELERKRFIEYLEWATKEVETWPEWKQNVLRLENSHD